LSSEGQGMYLTRAILDDSPYPVRAMMIAGANPALTFPGSDSQARALRKLDFLAVADLFLTKTARLATLVLPAADFLDTLELHDYGVAGAPYLGLVKPTRDEAKGWPIWKIIFELAGTLGLGSLFPWRDNREALEYRLSPSGVSLSQLERSVSGTAAYKRPDTPKPKIEYYSTTVADAGHPGLPGPDAVGLPPSDTGQYTYRLSLGDKVAWYQHSQFRNIEAYRKRMDEPVLDLHPRTASRAGVNEGGYAIVSTGYGSIRVKVRLSDDVREQCLRMSHGWEEANANRLSGLEHFDPVTGFPWLRALPAHIETAPAT
jgi:formate dehydrogenase (coenzyme F420) alpha subunit